MNDFVFAFARGVSLEQNPRGYFVISKAPVKILRINQSLFAILEQVQQGDPPTEILAEHPYLTEGQLLKHLITLTYRGYLRLEKVPDLVDFPLTSVIIPVRNPSRDLVECLGSVAALDYPPDKLEIVVTEDGPSSSPIDLPAFKIKHIKLPESMGPASARNAGAASATGEILAFLDADSIASPHWLKELIPFLRVAGTGAVGGLVEGYYRQSFLDRYEEVSSSLSLGNRIQFEGNTRSVLYVPTCNMLVCRRVFTEAGGFRDGMRLGEDVDFCWRMRKLGYSLLYVPLGTVAHKHRNQLFKMLQRRGVYGSTEAVLYRTHRDKRKSFLIPLWEGLSFLTITLAILLLNLYPLVAVPVLFGLDWWRKPHWRGWALRENGFSTLRGYLSFYYFSSFHLVRYYLILLMGLGFLYHPLWVLCAFMLLLTSIVNYAVKKPRLFYPVYLFFYTLEHVAYQIGVFWGCLKLGYFGSYLPVFPHAIEQPSL